MTTFKVYLALAISLLLSLLGLQHFKHKAETYRQDLNRHKRTRKVQKVYEDALQQAQDVQRERVQHETDKSRTKRDYFSKS